MSEDEDGGQMNGPRLRADTADGSSPTPIDLDDVHEASPPIKRKRRVDKGKGRAMSEEDPLLIDYERRFEGDASEEDTRRTTFSTKDPNARDCTDEEEEGPCAESETGEAAHSGEQGTDGEQGARSSMEATDMGGAGEQRE